MTRFRLTPEAAADLEELVDWVEAASGGRRADAVLAALAAAIRRLADAPAIGHSRADLTEETVRFWTFHSWFVVYRPDTRPLEIVRILHGARAPRALDREIGREGRHSEE